jgi:hypothetical protein
MDPRRVKSYNQIKLCMCMEYVGYMIGVYVVNPNSTMLLENIPLFWNLKTTLQETHGLSYSSSLFLGAHQSTHCFILLDTCLFFQYSFLFFMNNFFIDTCIFLKQNFGEITTRTLEHLLGVVL